MLKALGAEPKQIQYEAELANMRMDENPIDIQVLKDSLIIAERQMKRVTHSL